MLALNSQQSSWLSLPSAGIADLCHTPGSIRHLRGFFGLLVVLEMKCGSASQMLMCPAWWKIFFFWYSQPHICQAAITPYTAELKPQPLREGSYGKAYTFCLAVATFSSFFSLLSLELCTQLSAKHLFIMWGFLRQEAIAAVKTSEPWGNEKYLNAWSTHIMCLPAKNCAVCCLSFFLLIPLCLALHSCLHEVHETSIHASWKLFLLCAFCNTLPAPYPLGLSTLNTETTGFLEILKKRTKTRKIIKVKT